MGLWGVEFRVGFEDGEGGGWVGPERCGGEGVGVGGMVWDGAFLKYVCRGVLRESGEGLDGDWENGSDGDGIWRICYNFLHIQDTRRLIRI